MTLHQKSASETQYRSRFFPTATGNPHQADIDVLACVVGPNSAVQHLARQVDLIDENAIEYFHLRVRSLFHLSSKQHLCDGHLRLNKR